MPKILLVANPGDLDELSAALTGGDDVLAGTEIVREIGDDATLARFVELAPDVVVVAATLDDGDARALISAMRDAIRPAKVFVVLVGEVDGPIRTALDALGVGVERFVARPLSDKALRYAVTAGLSGRTLAFPPSPPQPAPPAASTPAPPAVPTLPSPGPDALRARWAALADELGDDEQRTPPPVAAAAVVADEAPGTAGEAADDEATADEAADELPELASPVVAAPPPWRPGSTEVPADPGLPVREPTLILSERAVVAGGDDELGWADRPASEAGAWRASTPAPLADDLDDDDALGDVAAGLDDELSVDLSPATAPRAAPVPPPAGGDFARELRKKMSQMAERLFKVSDLPALPVAIGPAHDHHTEIDLGGLVDGDDDVDLAAATFVGVDEGRVTDPLLGRVAAGGEAGEAGALARGVADAPALIARMFASDFTGRVVFRADGAEKVIHFEGGRPVFAASNLARDRMGELLVREGKITQAQHDRCQDLVRDTGRRMGEILVDRGYLKRRELLPAVRRHVEDIIYSLFAWDVGDYRVVAGDGATGERIRLSRHPAAMVLEGVRRKLDRATLEQLVGPPSTVVVTTDRDKLAAIAGVADLSAEERAALAALDGSLDLASAARATHLALASLYPLVWSLELLGLASARRRPGDDDGDAPALVGASDLAIDRARVMARAALVADADYFALLGVRRDATGFEVKRAYEAARRDFAPDGFPAELRRELAGALEEIGVVLDEAYRVLRDDALRAAYRDHLRDPGAAA
ncbi:MAG: hypothetical protein R3B06_11005 [Kofleriaceae bacterium]